MPDVVVRAERRNCDTATTIAHAFRGPTDADCRSDSRDCDGGV